MIFYYDYLQFHNRLHNVKRLLSSNVIAQNIFKNVHALTEADASSITTLSL